MKLTYATKAKLINGVLAAFIVGGFVILGYHSTRMLFAQVPAASGIGIYTDKTQYRVGEDVAVILVNSTPTTVYVVNNCPDEPLSVYHFENNNWASIEVTAPASKCAGEPHDYPIPSDSSIKTDYRYWPATFNEPGRYRIVANIESYSQGPSTEFTVVD